MNNANISPSKDTAIYDREAEQALLGTILNRSNAFILAKEKGIRAEHFYREDYRQIFKTLEKLSSDGILFDKATITEALKDKMPDILKLLFLLDEYAFSSNNIPHYVKRIIECWERRELERNAQEAIKQARDFEKPLADIKQSFLISLAGSPQGTFDSTVTNYDEFMQMFAAEQEARHYSTGLKGLDKLLDGGLYAGLYIVGAISSLGKTTLCLQIGDYIAAHGQDVLIFSLEMSRKELWAKSLSRIMAQKDRSHAKTTRAILQGQKHWNPAEQSLLADSIAEYTEKIMEHLHIAVGMGDITPDTIRAATIRHYMKTGNYPVIIIDYVQILAPSDVRATDKQNMDKAVLELKRISRDYNTPVIGISSFNRDNYTAPVNMAAFKESGSLEYSSDVLIGLQYDFMEPREGERKEARAARIEQDTKQAIAAAKEGKPIIINAKVLKNRNGSKGTAIMQFTPMFNHFEDVDGLLHGEPVSSKIIPR